MNQVLLSVLLMLFITSSGIANNEQIVKPNNLCNRIEEISILPFKGEPVDDEVYNGLLKMGTSALPCLIERISDTKKMTDPGQAPPYEGIAVGDVAFFVFLDIVHLSPEYFLPEKIKQKYKKDGIYAYFKFVQSPKQRKVIQNNLREWFDNTVTKKGK